MQKLKNTASENARILAQYINPEENFDVINKTITMGGRHAEFFFIDGFVKDDIMEKLMEAFIAISEKDMPKKAEGMIDLIPYVEVNPREDFETVVKDVLMGMVCMFVDGFATCFSIECRT